MINEQKLFSRLTTPCNRAAAREVSTKYKTYKEVYATYMENLIRKENGLSLRVYYTPVKLSKTKISSETTLRLLKNLTSKLMQVQPSKP